MNSETRIPAAPSAAQASLTLAKWADHIQPALGGQFLALFRHQAHVLRTNTQRDLHHLVGHRHFQIHARLQRLAQDFHVRVLDVAAILAQVQGDRVRPGGFRHQRRLHRAGIKRAARLAQGGDVVDVDAELNHSCCKSFNNCRVWSVLVAQIVIEQRAHQRLALLQRNRIAIIVGRQIEQGLAAQFYTDLPRGLPHRAALDHIAIPFSGHYRRIRVRPRDRASAHSPVPAASASRNAAE